MAESSIKARISADGQQFLTTLKDLQAATTAWAARNTQVVAQQASQTAAAGARAAGGFKNAGAATSLLELSRAIEDAQYGIRGVLNNIPQLALAMGAGAGLTGVVSIAAVAVASLGQAFLDFTTNAGGIKDATKVTEEFGKKLQAAVGKSAQEAIHGTAAAASELKDVVKDADEQFGSTSAFLAATQKDEEERLRAQMQARLAWLASIEEAAARAAIRQRETAEESRNLQTETERAHKEQVQQRRELLESQRAQLRTLNPQDPRAVQLAGSIAELESEQLKTPDRTRQELAANRAKAAEVDAKAAEDAAADAREKNAQQEAVIIAEIGNAKIAKAKEAAKVQKEADEAEDAFRREHVRQQKEELSLEERQLDKVIQLQKAYDKEAAALRKINDEHKEALGHLQQEARIKGLREQGRDTQANREERAMRIEDRRQDILKLGQSTPAEALQLATQLEGGRGRINARSRWHRRAGGIDEITEEQGGGSGNDFRKLERILNKIEDNTSGQGKNKSAAINKIES